MSTGSVGNAVRTVTTNANAMEQNETSVWDVMSHTADGLGNQSAADVAGRVIPAVGIGRGAMGMGEAIAEAGVHGSSVDGASSAAKAQASAIGEQFSNFFSDDPKKNPEGVLANVGAAFNVLTSIEQLWSIGFGMIPFPAFPALRVTDMDIGLPHAHAHPPNIIPPNPVPIPLPSTGPVIPIPLLSGASRTLINGMPAARCGDMGLGIWCGGYVPMFEVFLGSANVWIEGCRAGRMLCDITNHCIFSARPGDPPIGLFVGTTTSGSPNTMIGGVPLPSMLSLGMGAMFRGLGGLLKKFKANKLGQESGAFSRAAKNADDEVTQVFTRNKDTIDYAGNYVKASQMVEALEESMAVVLRGDAAFLEATRRHLRQIASSNIGYKVLDDIMKTGYQVVIEHLDDALPDLKKLGAHCEYEHPKFAGNDGSSSFIRYDPQGGSAGSPPDATLMHELGHSRSAAQGTNKSGNTKGMEPETKDQWTDWEEIETIDGVDNPYRKERGLPQRTGHNHLPK